jgi:uncharacterized OB-fold protein
VYLRPEQRLVPSPTPQSAAFWSGGATGELMISHCSSCGHFFHPPAPACWRCRSTDVAAKPVSGRGHVAAFTINRQPWLPGLPPPYVIAMIELVEDPDVRIMSNVVGIEGEDVRIGLEVEVFFEEWDDVYIPLFRPVEASA